MNIGQPERDAVAAIQANLAAAKDALRDIARDCRKLGKDDRAAGRMKLANGAMRLEGVALAALGALTQGHADASDTLMEGYDDAGPIIQGGGGGR